ncbi:MAG: cytochrome C oxidase subunit IV family protein [Pseudomonadota bacterium]
MASEHMSIEEVKKHTRVYWVIFGCLLALTVVTVGISYIHLPFTYAVILALVVATTKASLVALYFMHLISEKTAIYLTLGLTTVLFVVLMAVAGMAPYEAMRSWLVS